MKFGVMLTPHWPDGMTAAEVYQDAVGVMLEAERLGYWSAWTTEHHFGSDPSYHPLDLPGRFPAYDLVVDPLTFLSYVAARTSTLRLGTGVLVLHYDNPIRVAERAAMLDVMSGGRLELGLGRGGGHKEPDMFQVPADETDNQDKFFEALDVLRSSWSAGAFTHAGRYFRIPDLDVIPKPLQQPLPVVLANRTSRSLEYAARNGMSYVAVTASWGTGGIAQHNDGHALFEETAIAAGRNVEESDFPQTLFCYCAPTDEEAENVAEQYLTRFSAFSESHYENIRRSETGASPLSPMRSAGSFERRKRFEAQLETNLIGSPATICAKLRALRERIPSLNYVLAITGAGAPPPEFVRRSMRLFAQEVMPHFTTSEASRYETESVARL